MMLALMLVPLVVCICHSDLLDPTALTTVYEYTDAATGAVTQCAFGGGIFDASWQDIVSGLGWGLGYFGMPHILVRFMSIEKPSMIKKSSIVAIVWVIISLFSAVEIEAAMIAASRSPQMPAGKNFLAIAMKTSF